MATDEVLPALKRQLDCYQRLAKLANTQHDHVQNSRTEELLAFFPNGSSFWRKWPSWKQIIAPAKRNWKEYCRRFARRSAH